MQQQHTSKLIPILRSLVAPLDSSYELEVCALLLAAS